MDAMRYKGPENANDIIEWIGNSTLQVANYGTTQSLVLRVVDRRDDDPKVENARMLFLDSELGDAFISVGQYLLRNSQAGKDGYVTAYYYVVTRDELRIISAASTESIFIID